MGNRRHVSQGQVKTSRSIGFQLLTAGKIRVPQEHIANDVLIRLEQIVLRANWEIALYLPIRQDHPNQAKLALVPLHLQSKLVVILDNAAHFDARQVEYHLADFGLPGSHPHQVFGLYVQWDNRAVSMDGSSRDGGNPRETFLFVIRNVHVASSFADSFNTLIRV